MTLYHCQSSLCKIDPTSPLSVSCMRRKGVVGLYVKSINEVTSIDATEWLVLKDGISVQLSLACETTSRYCMIPGG